MSVYTLPRNKFDSFVRAVSAKMKFIAPVKRDVLRFEQVTDASMIDLSRQTYVPAKQYFFKDNEVLFEFTGEKITVPAFKSERRVFFGLRRCDLNAIHHQDLVYTNELKDPYYQNQRNNSLLIGFHCNEAPSKYCFCGSLNLIDFFDLMFFDRQDYFVVQVGTPKGEAFLKLFKQFFENSSIEITEKDRYIPGAERLEVDSIDDMYDNPGWKEGVDDCLSCGACTTLCPTCYCFEIKDEVKMSDVDSGIRNRQWSSCQLTDFTRVAGDHVFREKREERFKHRIYHQLSYFQERYGVQMCVGCGRCIDGCPTKIDFVNIINKMKEAK